MYKQTLLFTNAIAWMLLVLLPCIEVRGQITNGGFQSLICTINNGYLINAFNNNCVSGWKTSHGSPDLFDYLNSKSARSNRAYLASQEGIFTNYQMEEGHVYSLSLETAVGLDGAGITPEPQQVNIYVVAVNNLSSSNGVKPSPSETQVIATIQNELWADIKTSKVYNIIPKRTYNQVWIYWEYVYDGKRHAVYLDNISITKNCPSRSTLNYQRILFSGSVVSEGVIIRAGSAVNGNIPHGAVSVSANADVQFLADQYITLENEFNVLEGAKFSAGISAKNSCLVIPATTIRNDDPLEAQELAYVNTVDAFTVIPNPTNGPFRIVMQHKDENGEVIVIDSFGRPVYSQKIQGEQLEIDLSNLVSGVYTVKVVSEGKSHYSKIILQH